MTRPRFRLPFDRWPEQDRRMWRALTACGGPLDGAGALSRLRLSSQRTLQVGHARWLGWLVRTEPQALDEAPAARVKFTRLSAWMDALQDCAPMTRLMFIDAVLRVASAEDPGADWTAHRRLQSLLRWEARKGSGARKTGRVPPTSTLLGAGLRIAGPVADAATTPLRRAAMRRDGAMIAMLALMPMRVRAFAGLRIGRSLIMRGDGFEVDLDPAMTKSGASWSSPVPDVLGPLLHRWINDAREWLMRHRDATHDHLWVSDMGLPYRTGYLSTRIRKLTAEHVGVSVTPHFFRDAAATTLARTSPDAARLTRAVLGHSGFETATRHYNQARALEAGRDYATVMEALRGDSS